VDVCNESFAKKGLMSGSFAGLRSGLTAGVLTTRELLAPSSNTLMKMLRGAPWWGWFQNSTPMADQRIPAQ
jgi:hypothetical protein